VAAIWAGFSHGGIEPESAVNRKALMSRFSEIASVPVRFDHVASAIINADHSIM
jgi:hypothetical protein